MRKILFIALAAIMACGLQAQNDAPQKGHGKHSPEKMAQVMTKRMAKDLKLDKATEAKVGEINLKFAKDEQAAREAAKGEEGKVHKELKKLQKDKDMAFEKVLSPEQFAAYKAKRQEMKDKKKGKRHDGAEGGPKDGPKGE